MQPPERALRALRDAYGRGDLSTATLEARAEWVLGGRTEDALWDLAPRWWRPAAAVRGLVAGPHEWPVGERGRWIVGRDSSCDFRVDDDDTVSRRHAEIAVRGGQCLVRDLGSCNGTLVNGRPVRRARLRRGDVLRLGETELRVR
jgi:hypothetical protein